MSDLFSPLAIRGLTLANRSWVSPMCQYSAVDGVVGDWHLVHLGSFATGGTGLVFAEATAVSPPGRISVDCPGLWSDEHVAAWRRVTDFSHTQGAPIGIQLAHAGRKGSTRAPWSASRFADPGDDGWVTVAPSAKPFANYPEPHALDSSEIDQVVSDFVSGAKRALRAGFDVLEVHAAHGYLLHEFLSPLSNARTDEYGGSLENRARLLTRVATAIREAIPDAVPLFVRLSATDWTEGGWDIEDTVRVAARLGELGVDLIDVSSGGNVAEARVPLGPGYQVHFAERVRREARVLTSAVGLITEARQADAIIREGRADAVMLGRAHLRNPRWTLSAAEALGRVVPWPNQFLRARTLSEKA